jgi:hypothetical protein
VISERRAAVGDSSTGVAVSADADCLLTYFAIDDVHFRRKHANAANSAPVYLCGARV